MSLQDIEDPTSNNPAIGVGGWGLQPCTACIHRQHRSLLEQKDQQVDFSKTKLGIVPDVIVILRLHCSSAVWHGTVRPQFGTAWPALTLHHARLGYSTALVGWAIR